MSSSISNGFITTFAGLAAAFGLVASALTEGLTVLYKDTLEDDAPFVRIFSVLGFLIATVSLIITDPFADVVLTVRGAILLFVFLIASFSRIAAEIISAKEVIVASMEARKLKKQELAS
ncbi:MAG: hypothetical protein ACOYMB_00690 [Patescibacteria group bacterium]